MEAQDNERAPISTILRVEDAQDVPGGEGAPTSVATDVEELLADIFSHIEAQNARVVEVFFAVDSDGSGELDRWEFEEALAMMKINLTSQQITAAFSGASPPIPTPLRLRVGRDMCFFGAALDEDNGGTIEIEEFMTRMRREKKWRLRKLMQRTSKDNSEDIRIEALEGEEKAHAIEEAGKAAWEKAVMRAAISVWQEKGGGEMNAEEATWRKEELEAQLAEMEAEREEEEARLAEEMYNKEEVWTTRLTSSELVNLRLTHTAACSWRHWQQRPN